MLIPFSRFWQLKYIAQHCMGPICGTWVAQKLGWWDDGERMAESTRWTGHKLAWVVPLNCHTYFVEEVLATGKSWKLAFY